MRKLLIVLFLAVAFSSCKTPATALYRWGGYEDSYYNYYKKQSSESCARLYISYTNMIESPGGTRGVVPPGICAEYGYMLLSPETPSILKEYYSNPNNFTKKVRQSMEGTDWNQVFAPEVLREKGLKI